MSYFSSLILVAIVGLAQTFPGAGTGAGISIINTGKYLSVNPTAYSLDETGPVSGNMLNVHYFPGIILFNAGWYYGAFAEVSYVIRGGPKWLEENPRQPEFMSTAHYLRGMIYVYHAEGVGRYTKAIEDFRAALKWNPSNQSAQLELARAYSILGFNDQAISVIRNLLTLSPQSSVAEEARKELGTLMNKFASPPVAPPN